MMDLSDGGDEYHGWRWHNAFTTRHYGIGVGFICLFLMMSRLMYKELIVHLGSGLIAGRGLYMCLGSNGQVHASLSPSWSPCAFLVAPDVYLLVSLYILSKIYPSL